MIEWIPKSTGPLGTTDGPRWRQLLSSGTSWTGLRLVEGEVGAGELPEGYLRTHLVGMHLGRPSRHELSVQGQIRRPRTAMPEDVTVVPAGLPFTVRLLDPATGLIVHFEPALVSNALGADGATERLDLWHTCCARDQFVAQVLYALHKDARDGAPCGRLYGESLGSALVAHLLRNYAGSDCGGGVRKRGLGAGRLRRVVEYINDRLESDLSLGELAALVGLSPDHFARAFKQTTATSAHRYVLIKRIDRACTLLQESNMPIVDIAARCGFAGQSSFTTAFRRVKGITPRAYRNAWDGDRSKGSLRSIQASGADDGR